MELVDFNGYGQNQRMYGGTAGRKMGICFNGGNYILKFPGNLKEQQMKNIRLSYSNNPVCEYIGSQIYSLLGFEAHDTILGTRNGKVVVACKDFLEDGDRLYEFDKIKVTFEPRFLDSNGNETNGVGVDLYEICMTMKEHPFLKDISGIEDHFWNMFVVDALIGNTDRNNSNWGIILKADGSKKVAPVYDNGNCLNNKWDDEKIRDVLEDGQKFSAEAYKARRCIYELKGRAVNPYHLIERMEYPECTRAVERVTPEIGGMMPKIHELIMSVPVISEVRKKYYTAVLESRYQNVLFPVYQKLMREKNHIGHAAAGERRRG